MKILVSALAATSLLLSAQIPAQAQDDVAKKMIDNPSVDAWGAYGPQTSRKMADKTVQGGQAFEVDVPASGANPWDAAAVTPVTGKMAKGDKVICAVWMKAKTASGAPAKVTMGIQLAASPYTAIAQKDLTLTGEWALYSLDTVADANVAPNTVNLNIQVASAKQKIDFGPGFVVDMGPVQ